MAPTTVGPITITAAGEENSAQFPYQRKGFYANGRHWAFFVSGDQMVFSSSLDGVTWTAPTNVRAAVEGGEFSIWLHESSLGVLTVHYAYSDAVGGSAIYYRRGAPNADGTLTWALAEQIAEPLDPGFEYESIGITTDQLGGNCFICYAKVLIADPNNRVPMVTSSLVGPSWATNPGYPFMLSAVQDPSWTVIIVPFGVEVMTIYATDNGDILYRVLAAGIWGAETDSGFDISSSMRMSAAAEYMAPLGSPVSVHLVFQDTSEDLIHASYNLGWSAGHTILAASDPLAPMVTVLWWGNEDGANFRPSQQLYCFWLPLTTDPLANYVTYKVSRDAGVTWTNEAGAAGSTSWLDETGGPPEGFPNVQVGTAYYRSGLNPDVAQQYIGVLYTNRGSSPENVRFGALEFEDPVQNLAAGFWVSPVYSRELSGEFVVRHDSPSDIGAPDLYAKFEITGGSEELRGEFISRHPGSEDLPALFFRGADDLEELLGELVVRQLTAEELPGEFNVRGADSEDLLGELVIRRSASEELLGEFIVREAGSQELGAGFGVSRDDWISQGLNVTVYQALGIIS